MNPLKRQKPALGLVVRKNGLVDVYTVDGPSIQDGHGGRYDANHPYRLHLAKALRAGPLFIWPEGDAVGFTGRDIPVIPAGVLDRLTDGYVAHVVGQATRDANAFPKWTKILLWAGAGIIVLGAFAYVFWRKTHGA